MKTGPQYKIAKRLGRTVFEKTQTQKFALSEARSAKNKKGGRGGSEFGRQLLEKQKIRLTYGITEKQFANYVKKITSVHHVNPAESLHRLLEMRLDNIVYRLGLSATRRHARQIVSHGHILVNGKRVSIPSHAVKVGDRIAVREGSKTARLFEGYAERMGARDLPSWLSMNAKAFEGGVEKEAPYTVTDTAGDFASVFSFYSR